MVGMSGYGTWRRGLQAFGRAGAGLLAGLLLASARVAAQSCDPAWALVPVPAAGADHHEILALSGLGDEECWAVGESIDHDTGGTVAFALHRSGGQWASVPPLVSPSTGVMRSVAEIAPDDVWAVGGIETALAFHFDGTAWSAQPLPQPGLFDAAFAVDDVLAIAADDVWAIGQSGAGSELTTAAWHWDGSAWSVVPTPPVSDGLGGFFPSSLASISMAGDGALVAVGEFRIGKTWLPLAMSWDGTAWTLMFPPASAFGDGRLRSVSATSMQDIWAVGTCFDANRTPGGGYACAFALHFDGLEWSEVPVEQPSPWDINPLRSVLAGTDGVHAVGTWENASQGLEAMTLAYDGESFAIVPSPVLQGDGQGENELRDLARIGGEPWAGGDGSVSFFGSKVPLIQRFVSPCAASVMQVGTGTPPCSGPLLMSAQSVPSVGNAGFSMTVSGLLPSAPAVVFLGNAVDAVGSFPSGLGVLLHIDLAATSLLLPLGILSDADGGAVVALPIPAAPALAGMTVVLQAFDHWPLPNCQPSSSGWSSSPALVLIVQP